jgi:hypothetical protein
MEIIKPARWMVPQTKNAERTVQFSVTLGLRLELGHQALRLF